MTSTTARVPQRERSRATRQRLLVATVDCLVEHGWSGTSTTLVSRRAGVSRGAQLHHYPSKDDLVLAAVEHLCVSRKAQIQAAVAALPVGQARTRAVLEVLAEHATGPLSVAATELAMAARTEVRLREAVSALEVRVGRAAHEHTVEALDVDESAPGAHELVQATLALVRGLGLASTLADDAVRRGRVLDRWADVLDAELARRSAQDRRSRREGDR